MGGSDDFIAGANTQSLQGKVEAGCCGVDGDRFDSTPKPLAKVTFKLLCFGAAGNPAGAERGDNL
ncbi:hypothetical protein OF001_U190033 [Pseudomonas sp. OF001]|nr:hypothetical protein OF001_U190033 [Pseudomonas sp. OF001]